MNLEEILRSKDTNERTFGQFVRTCREEKGLSVRGLAAQIGCSAAYLSDIEKGNRYAPKKYLDTIFEVLGLPEEDKQDFLDLAGASRGFLYEDINSFFGQQPLARVALRSAMKNNPSDEYWQSFIDGMEKKES